MCFRLNRKKAILFLVTKNYRPVSLLPICGKVFERLIFNEMFSFIMASQSGFKPGDP